MERNKAVFIGIVFLLIFPILFGDTIATKASIFQDSQTKILYVGGAGPGNYSRIQDAIDNASDGDVVFVYDDSSPYTEKIWVNVSLSLLGENRNTTIIKGKEKTDIIRINRNNVTVHGFTLQGITNSSHTGIFIIADDIVISDTTIKNTSMGIYAISNYSSFTNNEFSSLRIAMWLLYSQYCLIADNAFCSNSDEDLTAGGSHCVVKNNIFTGIYGLKIWRNNETVVSNNTFLNSCSIDFYESFYNVVCSNTFVNGGFTVLRSKHNSVYNNTRNSEPIVYLDGEKDKTVDTAAQVVLIRCENIKVRGITITDLPCGIYLENTNNSEISDCVFSNCTIGISMYVRCCKNVISDCRFDNCTRAISVHAWCTFNTIMNNSITNSQDIAILIDSSLNTIRSNTISQAILGISLSSTHPYEEPSLTQSRKGNTVSFNTVQSAQYGIVVDACFSNVKGNTVSDCEIGIGITSLVSFYFQPFNEIHSTIIQRNTLENNTLGLLLNLSTFTIVKKNNFISNDQHAAFQGLGFYGQILGTRWIRNYWGEFTLPPKMIPGIIYVQSVGGLVSVVKWIEFDWLPALRPFSTSI
jgi:parallel beta-helix repeat protein